ncbi:hypothetical protein CN552_29265 [Bacillus wiedmannii]|nr:hypothetical protein CN552_29265 [Bacillus wiedmannii]
MPFTFVDFIQHLYKDMKVGTYFIVKNAELSTDTFHLVPTFLSIYRDKKMGTFLNKDTKVETL